MKRFFLLTALIFSCSFLFAQVPQLFTFQAVATDDNGVELADQDLLVRAIILSGPQGATSEWIEVHSTKTDEFGLFTINVGSMPNVGGMQANFADIAWGDAPHFLRIELDLTMTGSNFVFVDTKPLFSVPYALHSQTAEVAKTALDDMDRDATNELQELEVTGTSITLSNSPGTSIDLSTIGIEDDDSDPENEIQEFVLNGTMLNLSNSPGNPIDLTSLPINVNDADFDPSNELQDLNLTGSVLKLTNSNAEVDLGNLPFNVNDDDANPMNEIQDLQLNGTELILTNSPSPPIDLSTLPFSVNDDDSNPQNELQELELNGTELTLTNSSNPPIDLATLPFSVNDDDPNPQNEIQDFTINGTVIGLSQSTGPTIDLATIPAGNDPDPTNELQDLSINGDTLSISGGNFLLLSESLSGAGGFNDPGATIDFPQGVTNASYVFQPDTYTVPQGKTFYVMSAEESLRLPGVGNDIGLHLTGPNMPILAAGTEIDNCRCIGFLKEATAEVEPQLIVLEQNQGNSHTVPVGKNLVVKSGLDATTPLTLNGNTVNFFSGVIKGLVIPGGVVVRNIGNDEVILTGYLIEDN